MQEIKSGKQARRNKSLLPDMLSVGVRAVSVGRGGAGGQAEWWAASCPLEPLGHITHTPPPQAVGEGEPCLNHQVIQLVKSLLCLLPPQ